MEEEADPLEEARKLVPEEYHKFLPIFGEEFFTTLPPHRIYNCEIPLAKNATLPFGHIYPMSTAESQALATYIEEEMKAGKIHTSTSPGGAPVMFVKKKDGTYGLW